MKQDLKTTAQSLIRCAIYTRKSTSEGLEQEFNSLDAQREGGEAYIISQRQEGWECLSDRYDDGGHSGANIERPALRRLLADIEAGRIDCVVVYKVDRLSRSLRDFLALMEAFERKGVMFVSVTQAFNTATSLGRLMLNMLLSFAQFEREMISERTRDKMAAARRKGLWLGGTPILGYDVDGTRLVVNPAEADQVRQIFELYLALGGMIPVVQELARRGLNNKASTTKDGRRRGGKAFTKTSLHRLLKNATYIGKVQYQNEIHQGKHEAIITPEVWKQTQVQLTENGRHGGAMVRNQFGAILKGMLWCSPCGCSMSPTHSTKRGSKRYRYYRCQQSQQRGHGSCPFPSVRAQEIEQLVVDQLRNAALEPGPVANTVEQFREKAGAATATIEAEQHLVQRNLRKWGGELRLLLGQSTLDTVDSPAIGHLADLQDKIRDGEVRAGQLEKQLLGLRRKALDGHLAKSAADFDACWQSLTSGNQAKLVRLLVQRVDFDGHAGKVTIVFRSMDPVAS